MMTHEKLQRVANLMRDDAQACVKRAGGNIFNLYLVDYRHPNEEYYFGAEQGDCVAYDTVFHDEHDDSGELAVNSDDTPKRIAQEIERFLATDDAKDYHDATGTAYYPGGSEVK